MFESALDPSSGGVQRVCWILTSYFKKRGHSVFFAYKNTKLDFNQIPENEKFLYREDSNCKEDFMIFLLKNNIDIIFNHNQYTKHAIKLFDHLKGSNLNIRLFSIFHNSPEYYKLGQNTIFFKFKNICACLFHIENYSRIVNRITNLSDGTILLSESYIPDFIREFKPIDKKKISAIPNPLVFNAIDKTIKKKKQVIVIGRIYEKQKNIKAALRIWKSLEKEGYNGWQMILCGEGPDKDEIVSVIENLQLTNFKYLGAVSNPKPLYEESSIIMMTSNYEGFPMTILEAIQCGCVPIIFNSFSAIADVIDDGINGFVIQNKNERDFALRLKQVFDGNIPIENMSLNAKDKSDKFSILSIGSRWDEILKVN